MMRGQLRKVVVCWDRGVIRQNSTSWDGGAVGRRESEFDKLKIGRVIVMRVGGTRICGVSGQTHHLPTGKQLWQSKDGM